MKPTLEHADIARFRELVRARTGIALPASRATDLERAVQRATAESDLANADALYELLLGEPDAGAPLDALICALNVSETHFFRSTGQIEDLRRRILPELIGRRRAERRLRIWSAGCSTGEEPYTLAILLTQLLPDLARWDVPILATDINGRSLERARRGSYGAWSLRGRWEPGLAPYLAPRGERFEVAPSIRAMVTFAPLNLAEDVYPSVTTSTREVDLILCRNVLLYFDDEGARAVVGRLRDALADGGSLLVSPAEAGRGIFDGLTSEAPGTATFRKLEPQPATIDIREGGPAGARQAAAPSPARRRSRPAASRRRAGAPAPAVPAPRPPARSPGGEPSPASAADASAHAQALALWRAGRAEDALRQIEAITADHPLSAPLYHMQGLILLDADRGDEALAAFRRCTYVDPTYALGHLSQVGLFARAGLRGRALTALENAARLVEDLDADTVLSADDGVRVGDILELIASQRRLLAEPDDAGASDG